MHANEVSWHGEDGRTIWETSYRCCIMRKIIHKEVTTRGKLDLFLDSAIEGASKRLSKWQGLVAKAGENLGILLICDSYSIISKAFGIWANGKWSFMAPSSGKICKKVKTTSYAKNWGGSASMIPGSSGLNAPDNIRSTKIMLTVKPLYMMQGYFKWSGI